MSVKHELKTDADVFEAVRVGLKTYEIRFDDRGYSVGDLLWLRETVSTGAEMQAGAELVWTGRSLEVRVLHILRGPVYGLVENWVIMSTERVWL